MEIFLINKRRIELKEDVLVEKICRPLSLTGVNVSTNDLHVCHRMKRSGRVILKFKCHQQKNSIMQRRKNLGYKSQAFTDLAIEFDAKLTRKSVSLKFNGQQYFTGYF